MKRGSGDRRGWRALSSAERNDREAPAGSLLASGSCALAEAQYRRMVWLNPFEPRFRARLAWCLHLEGRNEESRSCLEEALQSHPGDPVLQDLLARIVLAGKGHGTRGPGFEPAG